MELFAHYTATINGWDEPYIGYKKFIECDELRAVPMAGLLPWCAGQIEAMLKTKLLAPVVRVEIRRVEAVWP